MKIQKSSLILLVCTGFALFSLGFFLGRNQIRPAVVTDRTAPTVFLTMPEDVSEPAFPLDINTATAQELTFLPGIGDTIAQRIIRYREENGPFHTPGDLMNVDGIGPSKLEEMLPYITIGG